MVSKTQRFGESSDRRFISGQKMPSSSCAFAVVHGKVDCPFRIGLIGRVSGIKADRQHIILIADVKLDVSETLQKSVFDHRAELWAIEIDQGHDDGFLTKIVAQADRLPGL